MYFYSSKRIKNYALRSYVWTHLFIIVQKLKGVLYGGIYGHPVYCVGFWLETVISDLDEIQEISTVVLLRPF